MNKQEIHEKIKEFIDEMEQENVKVLVQYIPIFGGCNVLGNMGLVEALGALEIAKQTQISSVLTHQNFDSYVQSVEKRPDLVRRLNQAMHPDCDHGD